MLPVLSSRHVSYLTRNCVYSSCFRNAILNVSKTWPLTRPDLQRLRHNDRAMIRQICKIKPDDEATVRSNYLLAHFEIDYIVVNLREKRLRWFVHVDQISGAYKTVCDMQIEVERDPGRPKTAWMTLTDRDPHEWKHNEFDPSDLDV